MEKSSTMNYIKWNRKNAGFYSGRKDFGRKNAVLLLPPAITLFRQRYVMGGGHPVRQGAGWKEYRNCECQPPTTNHQAHNKRILKWIARKRTFEQITRSRRSRRRDVGFRAP